MKIKILTLIVFTFFSGVLSAQETKPIFIEKNNQHSISTELLALSYSYAHKIKPKLILGARIQAGLGIRFLLTNPSFYYDCDQCPEPVWEKVKTNGCIYADVFKLQLFYRLKYSKHFYFDIGPYASMGTMGDFMVGYNMGLETSAFYTIWKLHLGFRMQAGWQYIVYSSEFTTNFFGLYVTPLVIGFNF